MTQDIILDSQDTQSVGKEASDDAVKRVFATFQRVTDQGFRTINIQVHWSESKAVVRLSKMLAMTMKVEAEIIHTKLQVQLYWEQL